MIMITEIKDKSVQEVNKLRKSSYRRKTGLTIVEGYPEVSRAARAGIVFKVLYLCRELIELDEGEFAGLPITYVTKEVFAAMAFGKRLKGILALCDPPKYQLSDIKLKDNPLIVVLEGVEKPGNFGSVIRTCDGAGVDVIIFCDVGTDVYNHNIVRASTGTVFTVPTIESTKDELLSYLRAHHIRIFAASSKAEHPYSECDLSGPAAICVGNEHQGLSNFWFEHADEKLRIPMVGKADSLNVTVSASILIYEAFRQRSSVLTLN